MVSSDKLLLLSNKDKRMYAFVGSECGISNLNLQGDTYYIIQRAATPCACARTCAQDQQCHVWYASKSHALHATVCKPIQSPVKSYAMTVEAQYDAAASDASMLQCEGNYVCKNKAVHRLTWHNLLCLQGLLQFCIWLRIWVQKIPA